MIPPTLREFSAQLSQNRYEVVSSRKLQREFSSLIDQIDTKLSTRQNISGQTQMHIQKRFDPIMCCVQASGRARQEKRDVCSHTPIFTAY